MNKDSIEYAKKSYLCLVGIYLNRPRLYGSYFDENISKFWQFSLFTVVTTNEINIRGPVTSLAALHSLKLIEQGTKIEIMLDVTGSKVLFGSFIFQNFEKV